MAPPLLLVHGASPRVAAALPAHPLLLLLLLLQQLQQQSREGVQRAQQVAHLGQQTHCQVAKQQQAVSDDVLLHY